jgi:formylglycine-generating enzyme required for sulfatase activity
MRGVPARSLWHSRRLAQWRDADGLAVVLPGAAAGYGGDRRRPVTGVPWTAARRAVGLASEGRGGSCRPQRRYPRMGRMDPAAYGGSP